jgi:hypothetical protein
MQTTTAIPKSFDFSAARLKGHAIGALICGVFGAAWIFQAVYLGAIATPVWLTAVAVLAGTLVVWSVTQLVSVRHAVYSSMGGKSWLASKAYWAIVAVEWLACSVAANWLSRIGRYDLMPQFLGVIVGLHFLPLAKIFRAPIYYWTGAAMALGVLAALVIPAGHVRNIAAWGAGGLSLWATAAVVLCKDRLSLRA